MKKKSILVLVLLLAIGFASVTTTLIINGVANIGFNEDDFGVIFTYANISDKKASKATISEDKKTITFKTGELSKKGETSILDYTVKNISTQYDANARINCTAVDTEYVRLKNVIDSRDITNMNETATPIRLSVNESKNGKITVEVIKSYLGEEKLDIPVTCEMEVTPIEPGETTEPTTLLVTPVEKVVKIDPNGGKYKNTENVYVTDSIETGNTYEIEEEPVREGYIFIGWQVSEENVYDEATNTVTMKQNDIILIANWEAEDSVARIESTTYPSIQSAIKDARKGDIIYLLKDTTENPVNNKEVTLDLGGYKVTGTLINEKIITIINGEIESTSGAAVINNGTLILGENDLDEENNPKVSVDSVALIGTNKGLEQNGVFNFYDGYIEGDIGIAGGYNDKPVGYIVFVDHNDEKDCQKVYLIDEAHISRTVAKTIETGEIYYYNLQDALNTTFDNEMVVYAIRNFEAPYTITVPEGSTGVFDITGYTVETGYTITNNGELTLIDTAEEKGVLKPSVSIVNNGKLNIKDIEITETTNANIIENNKDIDIKNSNIIAAGGYAIKNSSSSSLTMDNNTYLRANTYALYNNSTEEFIVSGGNVYGFKVEGKTKILNGKYLKGSSSTEVILHNSNTLTIEDIDLTSSNIAFKINANVVFNGGKVVSTNHCVENYGSNTATFTMTGGSLESTNASGMERANLNMSGGTITALNGAKSCNVNVTGGKIKARNYGVQNAYEVILTNGTIEGGNAGIAESANKIKGGTVSGGTYGIYITNPNISTEIGIKDETVNSENPIIKGDNYAIYQKGKFNFYDGILKGKAGLYLDTINEIPDGTIENFGTEEIDGEEYQTLTLASAENFARVGENEYNSLQKAINAIETEGTIEIFENGHISSETTIPNDKTIILDLSGNKITISQSLVVNGALTIKDSSVGKTGTVEVNNPSLRDGIVSKGQLTIDYMNLICEDNSTYIQNKTCILQKGGNLTVNDMYASTNSKVIISESSLTIKKGTIESQGAGIVVSGTALIEDINLTATNEAITHHSNGTLTIDGGTITSNSYGIIGDYKGTIIINGGTIHGNMYGIYNKEVSNYGRTITINGGTITGGDTGFMDGLGFGKSYITGGTITGGRYGLYVGFKYGGRPDNIGTKDNTIKDFPIIIGGEYGVYILKDDVNQLNYYDGVLKGKIDGYYGKISDMPEATVINRTTEEINEEEYKVVKLEEEEKFIKVGEEEFNSLQKAIDYIETEGTIKFILDATSGSGVIIPSGKKITIDLNNCNYITGGTIENNGELIISDSSTEKNGSITTENPVDIIKTSNKLTVNKLTIGSSTNNGSAIDITNGEATINDIKINTNAVGIMNSGTLTVNNMMVESSTVGIQAENGSSLTINNGTINASSDGIRISTSNLVTINNITINANNGLVLYRKTTTHLYNGNITGSTYGIYLYYDLFNRGAYINIYGGTISGDDVGIYDDSENGIVKVFGGTVSGGYYGLYYVNGKSHDNAQIIGEKGSPTSITSPVIEGGLYGIYGKYYMNDSIMFYDGKIKGKTGSFNHEINEVEDGYTVFSGSEGEYTVTYLVEEKNVISDGTNNYDNIQEAINTVADGTSLTLLKNAHVFYNIIFPENKSITIDFDGYNLNSSKQIINNGNVTLKNESSNSSTITSIINNIFIENNKELTIDNLNINFSLESDAIKINENGTLTISNSTITAPNGIENEGTLNITDTTITSTRTAIKNMNIINISDSTLSCSSYSYSLYDQSTNEKEVTNVEFTGKVYDNSSRNSVYSNNTLNDEITFDNSSAEIDFIGDPFKSKIVNKGIMSLHDFNVTDSTYGLSKITNNGTMNVNNITANLTVSYGGDLFNNAGVITFNNSNITINKNGIVEGNVLLNSGTATITNSEIIFNATTSSPANGINNCNGGTLNYNSGTITMNGIESAGIITSSATTYYHGGTINVTKGNKSSGIIGNGTGLVNIDNININTKGTISYGIYTSDSATVNIEDANILATGTTVYGIYVENGEVVLGEKDGNVSTTKPYVEAIGTTSGTGVHKVNGLFKYYDGKILGSTNAKPDTTTDTEHNYEATFYRDANNYEYCILEFME